MSNEIAERAPGSRPSRRRALRSGLGALGLGLGGLLRARAAGGPGMGPPPIRACILVFQYGGPSQLETLDPKPGAPAEVRGEFGTIATAVPGVRVAEHLPGLARLMDKCAIVRSMTHAARLHDSAAIHALTGRPLAGEDRELFAAIPQEFPSYGGAVAYLGRDRPAELPFAALPFAIHNVVDVPCQGGGFLGPAFDPFRIEVDPAKLRYQADALREAAELGAGRIAGRRRLLDTLRDSSADGTDPFADLRARAFDLIDSAAIRRALAIEEEPAATRERYGYDAEPVPVRAGGGAEMAYARNMRGQNLLLARRLVEAGVPFVNVYDCKQQGQNWDAHARCAEQHREYLLPQADRGLSALIEDLDARGLLESTLVVVMGEFGRTPRINANAGRDHWPDCYSALLAGGGCVGGAVYGSSDRLAAYPATDPVTPGDLAATIFWRFGFDPAAEIPDRSGRPHRLAAGEPLKRLFGA